jgi:hypothetical protein
MVDTMGGAFGGGLQGLDDHNPPANWLAQSCLSGTTLQRMSPIGSENAIMTKILSGFCISGGHIELSRTQSCRMSVHWARQGRSKSGYYTSPGGFYGPQLKREYSSFSMTKGAQLASNLPWMKKCWIRFSLYCHGLCLMPMEVSIWPHFSRFFANCSRQHSPG